MKCNKCGAENSTGSLFCGSCGAKIEAEEYKPVQNIIKNEPEQEPKNIFQKIRQKLSPAQIAAICSFIVIGAAVLIVLSVVTNPYKNQNIEATEDNNAYDYSDEESDDFQDEEIIDLSGEYDTVLASSPSVCEPIYEFVVKQVQTSSSVDTKVGVIKNKSEWLVPLTNDNPFLDNEKNCVGGDEYDNTQEKLGGPILYLDKGCFFGSTTYEDDSSYAYYHSKEPEIVYNSETNKYVDLRNFAKGECDIFTIFYKNQDTESENPIYISDGIVVFSLDHDRDDKGYPLYDEYYKDCEAYSSVYYIDLNSLAVKKVFQKNYKVIKYYYNPTTDITKYNFRAFELAGNYSQGLFLVKSYTDSNKETYGFYNLEGKEVFNLNSYVENYGSVSLVDNYFVNNKFRFKVKNELGNFFVITVDTNGKEISNVPE